MTRRSSPSPPTSARARRSSRRGARRRCSASSPRTSSSTICARNSSATSSSRCSAPTPSTRASTCSAPSIARPLIAKRQIEIARQVGADAVCHGATGKGNDQVRFELGYYALEPDIRVIAPWREWEFASREALLDFAEKHQIPIAKDKRGEAPFSVDANLLHSSSEGKVLEDPAVEAPEYVHQRTISPEDAPDQADHRSPSTSSAAIRSRSTARSCRPPTLLTRLNQLGHDNGIGRLDLVENRFVGMKSRGVYETPGGTILLAAHRGIESITLDRGAMHLKDELMPRYAELIYNGFWFSPEREMLQAADRQEPGACHRPRPAEALQGQCDGDRPRERRNRSTTRTSSPSRKAAAPTTSATPRASSSSTRCACARWRSGSRSWTADPSPRT